MIITKKFKINTFTAKEAVVKINVINTVLKKTAITYEEWLHIFFELGCQFIEKHIQEKEIQTRLLQDERFGFWDWFMIVSIQDDECLMAYESVNNERVYNQEKQRMLTLMVKTNQFNFFLNAKISNE